MDLGCGNGRLVATIARLHPGLIPVGVEIDPLRADRGCDVLNRASGQLYCADIFSSASPWFEGERHQLTILMVGRLLEADERARRSLVHRLRSAAHFVLLYVYADWLGRSEEIERVLGDLFPDATREGACDTGMMTRIWIANSASAPGPID
ncbi:MAG: class I SAM-dependent methyltransferase [Vitreimonas sp.]